MCLIQLRVLVIYLDPILCPVPRLHAPRHKGGINEIIIQQLKTPLLVDQVLGMGADRRGATSSIIASRTTT
jgi:hypothetical protein